MLCTGDIDSLDRIGFFLVFHQVADDEHVVSFFDGREESRVGEDESVADEFGQDVLNVLMEPRDMMNGEYCSSCSLGSEGVCFLFDWSLSSSFNSRYLFYILVNTCIFINSSSLYS